MGPWTQLMPLIGLMPSQRMMKLRKRIVDAACLRDDVSDDDLVDAVRRLASPSGETSLSG